MATVAEIETRVVENTGRSDLASQISSRVEDAIREIQRLHNLYFMEEVSTRNLVVNKQDYDVPADFKDVDELWLIEDSGLRKRPPLEHKDFEEMRYRFSDDDEGQPEFYSLYRGALWVFPPNPLNVDEKLELTYYKFLPVISGSQTNELTTKWPELVEAWATWLFYAKLPGAEVQADFWKGIAVPLMQELVKFSNGTKMKNKQIFTIRTSPQLAVARRSRAFGGR